MTLDTLMLEGEDGAEYELCPSPEEVCVTSPRRQASYVARRCGRSIRQVAVALFAALAIPACSPKAVPAPLPIQREAYAFSTEPDGFMGMLSQAQRLSEREFFGEFQERLESGDVRAVILGETHGVCRQKQFAEEVLAAIGDSGLKVAVFYDEMMLQVADLPPEGIYESVDCGVQPPMMDQPYDFGAWQPREPTDIAEKAEGLPAGEVVVTYSGNMHADPLMKAMALSLAPGFTTLDPPRLFGIPIEEWPTVRESLDTRGMGNISILMESLVLGNRTLMGSDGDGAPGLYRVAPDTYIHLTP